MSCFVNCSTWLFNPQSIPSYIYKQLHPIFRSLNPTNSSQEPCLGKSTLLSPHYSTFGLPSLSWSSLSEELDTNRRLCRNFVLTERGRETYTFLSNSSNSFLCAAILAFKARSLTVTTTHISPKKIFQLSPTNSRSYSAISKGPGSSSSMISYTSCRADRRKSRGVFPRLTSPFPFPSHTKPHWIARVW